MRRALGRLAGLLRGATRLLLLASGAPLLLAACAEQAPESERWARRFLPHEDVWRPLSEVPIEPQESPKMVIWEVSSLPPDSEPTAEQQRAADELVRRAEEVAHARNWFDFQQGLADGFKLMFADRRHYANQEFVLDEHVLDLERPEFLMYYGTPEGKQLAGMMFYTSSPEGVGPQPGGPLTLWHYHVWTHKSCLLQRMLLVGLPDQQGRCAQGEPMHRSPEMIHVWLVDHPLGPFSTSMYLEPRLMQRLLEEREQRWQAEGRPAR